MSKRFNVLKLKKSFIQLGINNVINKLMMWLELM